MFRKLGQGVLRHGDDLGLADRGRGREVFFKTDCGLFAQKTFADFCNAATNPDDLEPSPEQEVCFVGFVCARMQGAALIQV